MISFTGPTLSTERLTLRVPQAGDFPAFAAFQASDRAAARGWTMDEPALRDFWHKQFGHWVMHGFGWFVMERKSDGAPLGFVGLLHPAQHPEPEIAWTIWPDVAEGHGYAFEGAQAVLGHAFETLDWDSVPSYIAPDNTRSAALAKRLGAQQDGTWVTPNGNTVDVWRHRRAA